MSKNRRRWNTVKKFLIYNVLRLLSIFVPKNRKIWLFGEFYGQKFTGNPKYFYLFLLQNPQEDIRPIWISAKKTIVEEIRRLKGEAYRINSIKAIYFGLIAKVYIFSHGVEDIGNYAVRNALLVNLWHGMPVKDIRAFNQLKAENISPWRRKKIEFIQKMIKHECHGKYDLIIATSELTAEKFKTAFQYRPKKIAITGEPKNDLFFSGSKNEILNRYQLKAWQDKFIITYMPTFRDKEPPSPSQIAFWDEHELQDENLIVLLHWHPSDPLKNMFSLQESPFVKIANELPLDVQELLLISDLLITDYSSCFIDFLLLDRPIIFYAYDLNYYRKYRGFLYDYRQIAPGEITMTRRETAKAIRAYMKNPVKDAEKRRHVKEMFHTNQTGGFSQNVLKAVHELLR